MMLVQSTSVSCTLFPNFLPMGSLQFTRLRPPIEDYLAYFLLVQLNLQGRISSTFHIGTALYLIYTGDCTRGTRNISQSKWVGKEAHRV